MQELFYSHSTKDNLKSYRSRRKTTVKSVQELRTVMNKISQSICFGRLCSNPSRSNIVISPTPSPGFPLLRHVPVSLMIWPIFLSHLTHNTSLFSISSVARPVSHLP
ncbi:hypothetical protein XENOCAPTIV_006907 [Xenoophorus captivus]|uniref:Uncharacterized protein n=1 Tax=Xenoophorus captivus TaxID=1517983 RepID=A0ABV0R974_9TELE